MTRPRQKGMAVAIVGMDSWYPGAESLAEFWENILAKRQQFRRMPDQRLPLDVYHSKDRSSPDKTYGTEAAVLDGFVFDWQERRIPKKVVEATDIVHWLALEVALKALEHSRLDLATLQKCRTGVILGNTLTGEWTRTNAMRMRWPYMERVLRETAQNRGLSSETMEEFIQVTGAAFKSVFPEVTEDTLAGALSNTIAGRICNFLDLHGGGYTVDGACSSSLIAVITAARAIAQGDLDVAFAGGIDISLDTFELIGFAKTGALTPDEMRVYDRRANGFIPGEGCGFIVLKRLEDAQKDGNRILAVVQGWGISSDGKGGLTAPSVDGQAMAISDAYLLAGYGLEDVAFIEGHGTGTTVGDKVEISALVKALGGAQPSTSIGMTSLKSIVGHTKAAAGIGALIKAAIAVNQRVVPPMAGVEEPNGIFFDKAKSFYPVIEGEIRPKSSIMRAGISAMGFGGINSHVTLESYGLPDPSLQPSADTYTLLHSHDRREALVFSARTQAALARKLQAILPTLKLISRAELADLAYDATQRLRPSEPFRAVIVAARPDEAYKAVVKITDWLKVSLPRGESHEETEGHVFSSVGHVGSEPRIAFLFPGQGAQKINMGRRLLRRYPWAQAMAERAEAIYQRLRGESLLDGLLHSRPGLATEDAARRLNQTERAQPAISLIDALWFEMMRRSGVEPVVVAGHSLGELSALYAASVMDFDLLMTLATERGRLMAQPQGQAGAMLYVSSSEGDARALMEGVKGYATVANLNALDQTVLSGDPETLQEISEKAKVRGIQAGLLPVSNAFHSRYMDSAAREFRRQLTAWTFAKPTVPFIKGTDGKEMEGEDVKDYLSGQITANVQFVRVLETLKEKVDLIIEVGPGAILGGLARRLVDSHLAVYSVEPRPEADSDFKVALAGVYVRGGSVKWLEVYRERFVRPFTDPASRLFIESPTERPLRLPEAKLSGSTGGPETSPHGLHSFSGPTPYASTSAQPSSTRVAVMAATGSASGELAHTASRVLTQHVGQKVVESMPESGSQMDMRRGAPEATSQADTRSQHDALTIEYDICQYIAEQTGFDLSTLKSSQRLLDDLNLDSIKVTDLVGNISMKYGVAGELTASAYANATVHELAQAIKERLDATPKSGAEHDRAAQLGVESEVPVVASTKVASVPHASSGTGKNGMASVTAIASAAKKQSAPNPAGGTPIANQSPSIAELSRSKNRPAWVRDFVERYIQKPLSAPLDSGSSTTTGRDPWSWKGRSVVLYGVEGDSNFLLRMQEQLKAFGADVVVVMARHGAPSSLDLKGQEIVLTLMPGVKSASDRDDLPSVELLSTLARSAIRRVGKLVFVQFDDGRFGQSAVTGRVHSAKAFAQSMAHELSQTEFRVLSFDRDFEEQYRWILDRLGEELIPTERVIVAGYDAKGKRMVPRLELVKPWEREARAIHWQTGDVVIVTGGAKGITAVCGLAFAKRFGTTMVLVGSSELKPDEAQDPSHPVTATLESYRKAGLKAHYVTCDMTDEQAVWGLVTKIRAEIGVPRGVIHGAGTNYPRPASTVESRQAMREIAPKLLGMQHLLRALGEGELRLVVGLTSVIGVVGMPGNAWYGFANESLDLLLRSYAALHPQVGTQTCAFSVWSDVGMGARLGSDKNLEAKGIGAIGVEDGVRHFMSLMEARCRDQQVITTSRLGAVGQSELLRKPQEPYKHEFLTRILHYEPDVEVIAKTKLTFEKHPYLKDHNYKGAHLFPTVFGLEAMAQAVSCLKDLRGRASLVIRNIMLSRPITVGAQGTDIEIYAEELVSDQPENPIVIKAGIRTAATGYKYDHFAAEFVLEHLSASTVEKVPDYGPELGIKPDTQLYGSILFQGPLFQRIRTIHHLQSDNETAGSLVFYTESVKDDVSGHILGDPFVRDTLLQSAQLIIPQNQCLPIEIERLELFSGLARPTQDTMVFTDVHKTDEQSYLATVTMFDASQRVIQRLTNYRLRFLEKRPQFPRAMDLIPKASLGANPDVTKGSNSEAKPDLLAPYRNISGQLVIDAEPDGPQNQAVFVHRFIPDFKTFSNLSRSIYFSHIFHWMGWAREMSSMPVLDRIRALTESGRFGLVTNWAKVEVLGDCRSKNRIVEARMWCGEVGGSQNSSAVLTFDWVSKGDSGIEERIAVGRMGFTWVEIYGHGLVRPAPFPDYYKDFIASMVAQNKAPDRFIPAPEPYRSLEIGESIYGAKVGPDGGILMSEKTFETSLFDANLVGNLYFGNYSIWMGKIRDWTFYQMMPTFYQGTGDKGELTCVNAKIQHLREAMPFDEIFVTMSLQGLYKNGLDLVFEFHKKLADDKTEKLAIGDQRVIWTQVNERGERKSSPLPDAIVQALLSLIRTHTLGAAG